MAIATIPTGALRVGDRFRLAAESNHDYIVTEKLADGIEVKPLDPSDLVDYWQWNELPLKVQLVASGGGRLSDRKATWRDELRRATLQLGDAIERLRHLGSQPSNETGAAIDELTALAAAVTRAEAAADTIREAFGEL